MNKNEEEVLETPEVGSISDTIKEAVVKLKKDSKKKDVKEGVNLLSITKKLSEKKFGKKIKKEVIN